MSLERNLYHHLFDITFPICTLLPAVLGSHGNVVTMAFVDIMETEEDQPEV